MVVWIVIGIVVLALVILALSARAVFLRLGPLQKQLLRLERGAVKANELATVAQGLRAHADSLKLRAGLAQEQMEAIKDTIKDRARADDSAGAR